MVDLYMFYLGGKAGRANIEVHDVQFVVAESPVQAIPALRAAWFGDPTHVHLDGFSIIRWADGYDVSLSREPLPNNKRLFFVNVGAYEPGNLAELHAFELFVADNEQQAREKALAVLLEGKDQQHKDNLHAVDDCLQLTELGGWYIHLHENPNGQKAQPAWQGYQPIGVTKPVKSR